MDDALLLVAEHLLLLSSHHPPSASSALLAFVKLQATSRAVWQRYRHDTALWRRLMDGLPRWSLPEHMGLRRRAITGIKLLHGKCIACNGKAARVFMAFQARLCSRCCCSLLVSDVELAWRHGLFLPDAARPSLPYIVRYVGNTRVHFFLRQHLGPHMLRHQDRRTQLSKAIACMRRWPGVGKAEIGRLLERMAS
jgi:hypothetical protein